MTCISVSYVCKNFWHGPPRLKPLFPHRNMAAKPSFSSSHFQRLPTNPSPSPYSNIHFWNSDQVPEGENKHSGSLFSLFPLLLLTPQSGLVRLLAWHFSEHLNTKTIWQLPLTIKCVPVIYLQYSCSLGNRSADLPVLHCYWDYSILKCEYL